jgi:succinyl-diaminopimelate desuccinylase
MAAVVAALEEYKARLAERVFRSPDGETLRPTLNIGGVVQQGPGAKINTVPGLMRFSLDRRVLVNERLSEAGRELDAFLRAAARRIPGCRIRVEPISEHEPCFADPENAFADAVAESVRRVRREPVVFSVSNGFNDMHFFSRRFGVPTLGWGPGGRRYHAVDERASVRDLVSAAKVYARLLTTFAG